MFFPEDPQKQAMMMMAFGLLGGAPLAHAGLLGMQGYQGARSMQMRRQEEEQQRKLRELQIKTAEQGFQESADIRSLAGRAFAPPQPLDPRQQEGGQQEVPGGGGLPAFAQGLMGINPMKAAQFQNALAKDSPFGKVDPDKFTPESIKAFAASGGKDYSLLQPRRKTEVSNGLAYDPYNTAPGSFVTGPLADVIPGPTPGSWIPNPAKLALRKAGASNNNIKVSTGQTPFAKEFGENQAKEFFMLRKGADRAVETLTSLNQMREAMDAGMYTGGGAGVKAEIVNFLKPMGFAVDGETMANTQKFNMTAGKFLLQHAKDLGANPSNADAKRIEKIIGSADTDPTAMRQLLDWQEEMLRRTIDRYNTQYEQIKSNPEIFNAYDMSIKAPERYQPKKRDTPPAPKGASIDELKDHYLKRNGKR